MFSVYHGMSAVYVKKSADTCQLILANFSWVLSSMVLEEIIKSDQNYIGVLFDWLAL